MVKVFLKCYGKTRELKTIEWSSVVEESKNQMGSIDDKFYVVYQDEDLDNIVVKGNEDFTTAINWAMQNDLDELILLVPSDEESDGWDVVSHQSADDKSSENEEIIQAEVKDETAAGKMSSEGQDSSTAVEPIASNGSEEFSLDKMTISSKESSEVQFDNTLKIEEPSATTSESDLSSQESIEGQSKEEEAEQPADNVRGTATHSRVRCDVCFENEQAANNSMQAGCRNELGEIVGFRYKSAVKVNYDICSVCEATGLYDNFGPYLKIVYPSQAPDAIFCAVRGISDAIKQGKVEELESDCELVQDFQEFLMKKDQEKETTDPEPAGILKRLQQELEEEPKPFFMSLASSQQKMCKTHVLKKFQTHHSGFTCDFCNKKKLIGTIMYGCRVCNFDLCETCRKTNKAALRGLKFEPPKAKFVSDVTLNDGSLVTPGEKIVKIWQVQNSGVEEWPSDLKLVHIDGESFNTKKVELSLSDTIVPGASTEIAVALEMPTRTGRHTGTWRLFTSENVKFGDALWVDITVCKPTAPSEMANTFSESIRDFELSVAQITEFGFTDVEKVIKVLRSVNGDTSRAIDILLAESN